MKYTGERASALLTTPRLTQLTAPAINERQEMKVAHYYDENKLYVPLASWNALKDDPESEPYRDLVKAATVTIEGGGAFVIYRESDTSIMHKCDRMSELSELMA